MCIIFGVRDWCLCCYQNLWHQYHKWWLRYTCIFIPFGSHLTFLAPTHQIFSIYLCNVFSNNPLQYQANQIHPFPWLVYQVGPWWCLSTPYWITRREWSCRKSHSQAPHWTGWRWQSIYVSSSFHSLVTIIQFSFIRSLPWYYSNQYTDTYKQSSGSALLHSCRRQNYFCSRSANCHLWQKLAELNNFFLFLLLCCRLLEMLIWAYFC